MWGDFYAGAIHGVKLQQDSNLPAPNIQIQLIDQWGVVVKVDNNGRQSQRSAQQRHDDAQGKFWFLDVVPGFYTIANCRRRR